MPDAPPETVSVSVDGKEIDATPGELVIDACEQAGIYIPRFCYHPRMRPVGMCRMCIVDIDTGRGPTLQPSCMIPVTPGMTVSTQSEATVKAQDGVLEFLLINHPLDCPVCDKGGECPLQDQTLAYGPGESRFIEEKRHFEKPIPVNENVYLDRERCILCDRCTRFAKEVAGDPLISFQDRGNQTQVNTFPDHAFASYFAGNTVQICPVGALTARPYRFRARPWDLEQAESTCQSCAVGCRVVIDSSRNEVLRYNGVDIDPVNWGWMCDKGRFDFQSVQHQDRLVAPLVRGDDGELAEARWSEALGVAAAAVVDGLERSGPDGVAVLGGARLTNEAAYAWAKLAKGVIGTDHVDAQLGDGLPADAVLGLPRATIDDVCAKGGTVVLIGPDLKEELPVLYLRLRHAVIEDGVSLVELSPTATSCSELAAVALRHRPGEAAALLRQVLEGDGRGDGAPDQARQRTAELQARAREVLGKGPLTVILGRSSMAHSADEVVAAAAYLLEASPGVRFLPALRRANVHGALDMGLAPGLLPGRTRLDEGRDWFLTAWDTVPDAPGLDATGILTAAADGRIDTLFLLGADPLVDFPDRRLAARALAGARTVVATDLFLTESSSRADVVLPAAGYAEVAGSTTNMEGRVSTLGHKVTPPGTARPDWMLAAELALRLGADLRLESLDEIWDEIEELAPSHAGITLDLLRSGAAADGVVAPLHRADLGATEVNVEGTAVGGTDVTITGEPFDADAASQHAESAGAASAADAADEDGEAVAADVESQERASEAAQHEAAAADEREAGDESAAHVDDTAGDERAEAEAAAGEAAAGEEGRPHSKPAPLSFDVPSGRRAPPPVDAYSLRLVTERKLYDRGTLVQHSPAIADLAAHAPLRVNPSDFDRLGIADGSQVKVSAAAGSLLVAAVADPGVPRGTVVLRWNQGTPDPGELIDATLAVTDVRVETTP